jgi:hypothetical protein
MPHVTVGKMNGVGDRIRAHPIRGHRWPVTVEHGEAGPRPRTWWQRARETR